MSQSIDKPVPTRKASPGTAVPGSLFRAPQLAIGAFLLLWFGQFFLALVPSWGDGTYYDYGFLTPLLLPLVLLLRWQGQGLDRAGWQARLAKVESSATTWILLGASVAALIPLRLIETVDAAWRLPLYLHGGIVLVFAGYLHLRLFGGASWKSFVPVAVLLLLSIPLPRLIEASLIHGLTAQVTETAAIATRWLGIPVEIAGETLLLDNIPLQVGEGCSGVRSFQGVIFAGFLMGELVRLGLRQRLLLIAVGVGIAFLANCARVIFLVHHAAHHGEAHLQSLHDTSGNVSTTLSFAMLLAMTFLLRKQKAS